MAPAVRLCRLDGIDLFDDLDADPVFDRMALVAIAARAFGDVFDEAPVRPAIQRDVVDTSFGSGSFDSSASNDAPDQPQSHRCP